MSNTLVLRTTPLTPVRNQWRPLRLKDALEIPRRWDTSIAARGVKLSTKIPLDMSSTSVLRTRPLTYVRNQQDPLRLLRLWGWSGETKNRGYFKEEHNWLQSGTNEILLDFSNQRWCQVSKPDIEFHVRDIVYGNALSKDDICLQWWICVSVFKFSIKDYLPPCELTKMVFYTWKCFLPKEYKPLCELTKFVSSTLKNVFYPQNIHLWLKYCFLHLKILFTWRIYTSVRMFVKFMHWIITSVRVD